MKQFRVLEPDEIECRIAQATKKGVSLLLYKTARTDADLLDETVGPENWQNDFKLIDGVLYGGIGVDFGRGLVWKWDAGTESNTEAEKGRASDAFKRAGFKHGIGRELYSSPFIWIQASKCKNLTESEWRKDKRGNPVWECKDRFYVSGIGYDDKEKINFLSITNGSGETVFEMGEGQGIFCDKCGKLISDAKRKDGSIWTADEIAEYTKMRYGMKLCTSCGKKADKGEI